MRPHYTPLSEAELGELDELAAERSDLAEQKAGYVSDDEMVTILLVVILLILIL